MNFHVYSEYKAYQYFVPKKKLWRSTLPFWCEHFLDARNNYELTFDIQTNTRYLE